jgi:hypothetical protein
LRGPVRRPYPWGRAHPQTRSDTGYMMFAEAGITGVDVTAVFLLLFGFLVVACGMLLGLAWVGVTLGLGPQGRESVRGKSRFGRAALAAVVSGVSLPFVNMLAAGATRLELDALHMFVIVFGFLLPVGVGYIVGRVAARR